MLDYLEGGEVKKLNRLNDNVRLVVMQFACSKKERMPVLKWLKKETMLESDERMAKSDPTYGDGKLFMDTEVNTVSVYDFLSDLEEAGYEIIDAFNQERIEWDLNAIYKKFYIARFIFAHREYVNSSKDFENKRDMVHAEFLKMAMEAIWRVKGFSNPFYKDDERISGQYTISVNMVARNPLVDNEGRPLYIWKKDEYGQKIIERDENGKKIGDAKILVKPKYCLRIENNCVELKEIFKKA